MDFGFRSLRGFAPFIWFLGLAVGFALSWDPLLEHLAYIEAYGDVYYRAVLTGLAVLLVALPLYQWIRRRGLWRYELLVLAAWPLAVCLLREPVATFTILWMLTACYLVGGLVLDKLNLDIERDAESFSLSITVGMGLLICALFVLGMTGSFYWWVFALLVHASVRVVVPGFAPSGRACGAQRTFKYAPTPKGRGAKRLAPCTDAFSRTSPRHVRRNDG